MLTFGVTALVAAAALLVLSIRKSPDRAVTGVDQIGAYYSQVSDQDAPVSMAPQRSPVMGVLRRFAVRVSPAAAASRLQDKLDVAGNPGGWDTDRVLALKTAAMLGLGLFGVFIGARHGALVVFTAGGLALGGFFLPDVLVYNTGLKRQEKMQKALPDAIDMMTVCVEAGLGFDAAVAQVARNTSGPLASEFARVLQEMQFGKSRVEALKAMAERTTVRELRLLVSALVQASELGIPVAAVMREQSIEMRLRRRQRAEEKAQKVTVKILFPLVFCLLPALFIVVIGPGVINIIKSMSGM